MKRQGFLHLALTLLAIAQPAEELKISTPAPVTAVMLARTGALVAAVCEDQKLRLWTLPDGRLSREISLGKRSIDAAVISADARKVAVGDHSGVYTVWDVGTGVEELHVRISYYPFALAFSPDGRRLAIAPAGQPVQLYELDTGKRLLELRNVVGGTAAIAFSTDGRRIATADSDTAIRIYDSRNGELLASNTDFLSVPLAVAFTPDGKHLLAGGADKVVVNLSASTGKAVMPSARFADPVAYLAISPDGVSTVAALMHADNLLMPAPVIVTDTKSGRKVQEWKPPHRVLGGEWINAGHLLIATGGDKALHLWRLR